MILFGELVGARGFEPRTSCAQGRRATRLLRPRQARYQAALRPDMKYVKIIKDFPTELLLHLTNFASNCAKTVPNRFH